jgi:hypothetical protein
MGKRTKGQHERRTACTMSLDELRALRVAQEI